MLTSVGISHPKNYSASWTYNSHYQCLKHFHFYAFIYIQKFPAIYTLTPFQIFCRMTILQVKRGNTCFLCSFILQMYPINFYIVFHTFSMLSHFIIWMAQLNDEVVSWLALYATVTPTVTSPKPLVTWWYKSEMYLFVSHS